MKKSTTNTILKELLDAIQNHKVTAYDSGPNSGLDHYTIVIDNDIFGMSDNPLYPLGVNLYVGSFDDPMNGYKYKQSRKAGHFGKQIALSDLPEEVQKAIVYRIKSD